MNPFALQGFSFLGFYLITGIIVVWCYRAWILKTENDNAPTTPTLTDPYLIAHLRADEAEALRVATVALLDRGILNAHGEDLKAKNRMAGEGLLDDDCKAPGCVFIIARTVPRQHSAC